MRRGLFYCIFVAGLVTPVLAQTASPTFHGVTCTKDCSGHRAGYDWAAKKDIHKTCDCRGRSVSFVEGCRIWVQEHHKS